MGRGTLADKLYMKKKRGEFLVAAGVDSVDREKICTSAGSDFIMYYPTSRYRHAKNRFIAGFVALGNTNKQMLSEAEEVMPLFKHRSILAGVNASDPFKLDHILLKKIEYHLFEGIHNYPTIALIDGEFGANINASDFGFDKELDFFKLAKKKKMFTCAMVCNMKQAIQMLRVDVDVIIFYLGLGEKEIFRHKDNMDLIEKDIRKLRTFTEGIRTVNPDIPILFYNERVNDVEEIRVISREVPEIDGYCFLDNVKKENYSKNIGVIIQNIKEIGQ